MSFPEADRREAEAQKFPGLQKCAENALKQVVFQWKIKRVVTKIDKFLLFLINFGYS